MTARSLAVRFGAVSAVTLAAVALLASIREDDSTAMLCLCLSLASLAFAGIFSLTYPEA